jgi:hypothetical protein
MQVDDLGELHTNWSQLFFDSDMTAIAIAYTGNAFVVGSDGLGSITGTPSAGSPVLPPTDDAQKIFYAESDLFKLAYGITGFVYNEAATFSMIDECAVQLSIPTDELESYQYLDAFARRVKGTLIDGLRSGLLEPFPVREHISGPEKRTVSRIMFAGYFESEPCFKSIRIGISRKVNEVLVHEVESYPIQAGSSMGWGSEAVAKLSINGDPRFARYKKALTNSHATLDSAMEFVKAYIRLMSDPQAAAIDQKCKGIGGKIQIAKVMQAAGFEWFPGFEAGGEPLAGFMRPGQAANKQFYLDHFGKTGQ